MPRRDLRPAFGLVHGYWGAGGRLGLADGAESISDRPWFLAYDLAAGLVFLAAAAGAAVLSTGLGSARARPRVDIGALYDLVFTFGGLVFLRAARLLRAAPSRER